MPRYNKVKFNNIKINKLSTDVYKIIYYILIAVILSSIGSIGYGIYLIVVGSSISAYRNVYWMPVYNIGGSLIMIVVSIFGILYIRKKGLMGEKKPKGTETKLTMVNDISSKSMWIILIIIAGVCISSLVYWFLLVSIA